jgi:catechol 2,3-dioxygenase-like lactoylglutathione lyase family enzyme
MNCPAMTGDAAVPEHFRVQQIDHVEVFVPDRVVAAAWYRRVLGLAPVPSAESWAADPRGPLMISSDGGQTMVALFQGPPQGSAAPIGFSRLAFRTDSAAFLAFVERWEHTGVPDSGIPLRLSDHATAFSAYFTDPYGNALEVTTYEHEAVRRARAAEPA